MNVRRIAATATLISAMLVTVLPGHASAQSATSATAAVSGPVSQAGGGGGGELDWPWGLVAAVSDWPWGGPGTEGKSPE